MRPLLPLPAAYVLLLPAACRLPPAPCRRPHRADSTRDTAEQARLEGRGPGRPSMERIGGLWNSMPEQERAVWEQRAAELRWAPAAAAGWAAG